MKKVIITIILVMFISGCATAMYPPPEEKAIKGIYHRVKKNETLRAISKAYGVSLEKIVDSNRIPNADRLSVGQLIFIPGRFKENE